MIWISRTYKHDLVHNNTYWTLYFLGLPLFVLSIKKPNTIPM